MNAHAARHRPQAAPDPRLGTYAEDLRLIARLHERELTPALLAALVSADFPRTLTLVPADAAGEAAYDILAAALHGPEGSGAPASLDALHADFAAIYLNHGFDVSPNECVFLDPEGLILQEPMFEVRRWYAHYGLKAQDWRKLSDDHLMVQLEFLAHLLVHPLLHGPKDAAAFMDHHILRWIEHFARRVATRCDTQFYAGLALATAAALKRLRRELVEIAGMPLVDLEPIEEERLRRRAKAQAEAQRGAGAFLPGAAPSW